MCIITKYYVFRFNVENLNREKKNISEEEELSNHHNDIHKNVFIDFFRNLFLAINLLSVLRNGEKNVYKMSFR